MPEHYGLLGQNRPQTPPSLFSRVVGGIASGARTAANAAGRVVAGPDDQNLTPEQNAAAARQARLQAGLAMIMASQSGPGMPAPALAQILAQGVGVGNQVGGGARSMAMQQQAMQRAIQSLPPEVQAQIAALPPQQQAEVLKELMLQQGGDPKVLGPGDRLVSPTGQLLFEGADQGIDLPADMRALAFGMGLDLTQPLSNADKKDLLQEYIRLNTSPRSTTQVIMGEEGPLPANVQGHYDKMVDDAVAAMNTLSDLRSMEQLLQAGTQTNRLESMLLPLRQLAVGMGLYDEEQIADVGLQEAFRAVSDRMTLGLAEQLTGPKSDNDIKFLQSQVPQLANTQTGNYIMIEVLRRIQNAKIQMAQHMTDFFQQSDRGQGWLAERVRYAQENALDFTDLVEAARFALQQQRSP